MSDLPPGFTLDQPQPNAPAGLPPGFTVDTAPAAEAPPVSGSILPLSRDAQGNISFDPHAGILGTIERAFTLPHDVMVGKVDPLSDQGIARAAEMATVFSPSDAAAARAIVPKVNAPTAEALKAAAGAGYDAVRDMGVDYSADAVKGAADAVRAALEGDGIIAEIAPKSFAILDKLSNPPAGSVATSAGLEAARRALGKIDVPDPTERLAARRMADAVGDFVRQPPQGSVISGPAADAGAALDQARGNYAAAMRSNQLQGIEDAADLRAAAANSGQNTGNAIRQRVASLLINGRGPRGFTDAEQQDLEGVVRGGPVANAARIIGNALGGGGGLGTLASTAAGGIAGGVPGAVAAPAAGLIARALANAMTRRALGRVDEATRARSPLYEDMQAQAVPKQINPVTRAALIRLLLANSLPQSPTLSSQ